MGYESRLHIVERHETVRKKNRNTYRDIYCLDVARFELCKMDNSEFWNLFHTPIDFELDGDVCENGESIILTEDCYGKHCCYAEISEVIEWLEKEVRHDDYRRLKPLLALLKGFDLNEWNYSNSDDNGNTDTRLIIVHYGH